MLSEKQIERVNRFLVEQPIYIDKNMDEEDDFKLVDLDRLRVSQMTFLEKYKVVSKFKTHFGHDITIYETSDVAFGNIGILDYEYFIVYDSQDKYQKIIGVLGLNKFEPKKAHPGKDLRQVAVVKIEKSFHNNGIAQELYKTLVKHGVTLVSDGTQYKGARRLWQYLAEESVQSEFRVLVFDTNVNDFIEDGRVYDGNNINPSEIWGDDKEDVLLCLVTK